MLINIFKVYLTFTLLCIAVCVRKFSPARKTKLREEVRGMFQHAYEGYLQHASNFDELRPLTCDGINTWGSYSLTLIDALDTLAVIGNYTEFRRVAHLIINNMNFDNDINVSVFETNIRIVGGLLSAHLMARKAGMELEPGWPCNGPLLTLAADVAKRLLPAFETETGMPYGTVNLRRGVPTGETSVTCTAGVGTFIVEFGALSRLTGDPIYEEVALNAIYSLWEHRSQIGLLGNHIDVQTGKWTAQDAGIGAGVDSFFEYLVKGAIMLNRPDLLEMFHEGRRKIDKYMKRDDWYVWVGMNKGQVTLPVFQSLEAYWPGVLSVFGDISPAMKTLHNYHTVWRQYGFLPEFYNIPGAEAGSNRESYPLRPELAESAMYLFRATKDPYLLEVGEDMLRSIEYSAKTSCGYATIRNVRDHRRDNRMESFFLSETTKYLYLLFDDENFIHNNGREGRIFDTPNGMCILEAGGYIFNTEAHPIDPSALNCCYDLPQRDIFADFNIADYHGDILMHKERQRHTENLESSEKYSCPDKNIPANSKSIDSNLTLDIEVPDVKESGINLGQEMLENFQKIQKEALYRQVNKFSVEDLLNVEKRVSSVVEIPAAILEFMKNHTVDPEKIRNLFPINSSTPFEMDLSIPQNIWSLYVERHRLHANIFVIEALDLQKFDNDQNETQAILGEVLELLSSTKPHADRLKNSKILRIILAAQAGYTNKLANVSEMLDFTILFAEDIKDNIEFWQLAKSKENFFSSTSVAKEHISSESNIDLELFDKLYKIAKFKKRMIETFQKLQSIMKNNVKEELTSSGVTEKTAQNHDIISVDAAKPESIENTFNVATSPTTKIFKQKPDSSRDESTHNSILTDFVHSIIKSTLPPKAKFDEQMFLKKIRSNGVYRNQTQKYQLLTCRANRFAERFAHRFEVV